MASSKDTAPSNLSLSKWVLEPIARSSAEGKEGGEIAIVHKTSGRRYEYTFANNLVDGIPHPPFIQEHVWKAQRSQLTFRSDDVFIATYSKCGTTLTEQIVLLLLNDGNAAELNPLHKNTLDRNSGGVGKIWTEMAVVDGLVGLEDEDGAGGFQKACMGEGNAHMSVVDFDALPTPRILKTHAPTKLFLDGEKKRAKVIYVTRNPFDACVSCYYHVSLSRLFCFDQNMCYATLCQTSANYRISLTFILYVPVLHTTAQARGLSSLQGHALRCILQIVAHRARGVWRVDQSHQGMA